jgi:hypothetical protein
LPDELDDERLTREGLVEGHLFCLGDLVDQVRAALEGELFGQDERVVAVEEDGVNLGVLGAVWIEGRFWVFTLAIVTVGCLLCLLGMLVLGDGVQSLIWPGWDVCRWKLKR